MSRRPTKYIRKILDLRRKLWPEVQPAHLWHRKRSDGFVTIPRTMPLILGIIDDLTKGAPAASTYFELWCRAFDEMYVSLSKSRELAFIPASPASAPSAHGRRKSASWTSWDS